MANEVAGAAPWIGRPRRRVEDAQLVTGRGQYVDDVRLNGALTLALVRSPYPAARIMSVDVEAARALPGVVDVVTGQDTAHLSLATVPMNPMIPELPRPLHPLLAINTVHYVGQAVVGILAESRAAARDAAELVVVEYEPEPSIADAEAALEPGAPSVHADLGTNLAFQRTYGSSEDEVEAAFAGADHVVRLRVAQPRIAAVAIEPRNALATFDEERGILRVWANTQRPSGTRDDIAAALELPKEQVHVIAPHVGGAFGAKGNAYRDETLAAFLAVQWRRPVQWTATRSEDFLTTQHGRDMVHTVEAAFTRDGELLAMRLTGVGNLGAFPQPNAVIPPARSSRLIPGAYRARIARSEIQAVFTNTTPTGPYRGAGRPESAFLVERVMDTAARELGLDPAELRRRNFIRPDEFPWTTPVGSVYDSGDYQATLDLALKLADYPALLRQREAARGAGQPFGIGIATFVEPSGGAGFESGQVRVEPDGTVVALSGAFSHGQGHATTFQQILADRMGVPPEQVRLIQGDTSIVPDGVGTFGSRSIQLGGSALVVAADRVLEQMRKIAGFLLETSAADVQMENGQFFPAGVPGRALTFAEVAAAAHQSDRLPDELRRPLDETERFMARGEAFSHGAHVAAVRIDRDTGRVQVQTYVAVDDAGVLINPLLAEGQVHGGLAQGFGQAFSELVRYEPDGTLVSGTLGDYAVPRAGDVPAFVLGETQTPSPLNPLGAKGVGEGGAVGAPAALANAILDALAPYGVKTLDMPFTAERIWQALQEAAGSG